MRWHPLQRPDPPHTTHFCRKASRSRLYAWPYCLTKQSTYCWASAAPAALGTDPKEGTVRGWGCWGLACCLAGAAVLAGAAGEEPKPEATPLRRSKREPEAASSWRTSSALDAAACARVQAHEPGSAVGTPSAAGKASGLQAHGQRRGWSLGGRHRDTVPWAGQQAQAQVPSPGPRASTSNRRCGHHQTQTHLLRLLDRGRGAVGHHKAVGVQGQGHGGVLQRHCQVLRLLWKRVGGGGVRAVRGRLSVRTRP